MGLLKFNAMVHEQKAQNSVKPLITCCIQRHTSQVPLLTLELMANQQLRIVECDQICRIQVWLMDQPSQHKQQPEGEMVGRGADKEKSQRSRVLALRG